MASFKESSVSRPMAPSGPSVRQAGVRNHSHSLSLGAANANHRVTRRKSMTSSTALNAAAVAASLDDKEPTAAIPVSRRAGGRKGTAESSSVGTPSGFTSYLSRSVNNASVSPETAVRKTSPSSVDDHTAVDGARPVSSKPVSTRSRNRRASEGSHLVQGKRFSTELRCEQCGKGYKHSSCLLKHRWEHDPAWAFTSKLLISKHQQVQLLEAASVLVNMNQKSSSSLAETQDESDNSSASAAASSTEMRDGISSTETTPPPTADMDDDDDEIPAGKYARSQSFRSTIGSSSYADSGPLHSPAFSSTYDRQPSIDTRPSTAITAESDHNTEDADLAAAIRLCNFGTPRTKPVSEIPSSLTSNVDNNNNNSDVPPVPPLPAQYLGQSLGQSFLQSSPFSFSLYPSLSYRVSDERDVKMGDGDAEDDYRDRDRESRQRRNADVDFGPRPHDVNDDDDGVFGRMEE